MKLFCLVCLVMNFWVVVVIILVKSECLNRALLLEAMVLFVVIVVECLNRVL